MERVSVKTKLIILIVLICGFILLINNYSDASRGTVVTSVKMDHWQRNLFLNGSGYVQLNATVYPRNAGNKKLRWTSSNTNVAVVNQYRKSNR